MTVNCARCAHPIPSHDLGLYIVTRPHGPVDVCSAYCGSCLDWAYRDDPVDMALAAQERPHRRWAA